jgi:hypothetical protein
VQTCFKEKDFVVNTETSYNDVMSKLADEKYNSSLTGIKGACCLHELKYFHVTKNWAPDIMDNMLGGVLPLECALLLSQLQKQKLISLSTFSEQVQLFNYSPADMNSKPHY